MSETADRYRRYKTLADHRKEPAAKGWELGYEAGWTDAADRWMATPTTNDFGPTATLAQLRDELGHVTLDGIALAAQFHVLLDSLAEAIRYADDDTTTWSEAA